MPCCRRPMKLVAWRCPRREMTRVGACRRAAMASEAGQRGSEELEVVTSAEAGPATRGSGA
uniref:Uncharacterized protein n=1 Tax=Triticum urartu TaxID=4572 RepID=A0A8R7UI05_TRIUA